LPGFFPLGGPGGGATYGTEYSQAQINNDLTQFPPAYATVRSIPGVSSFHGTLVASCAAGSQRPGFPYGGAAPGADIIYVRTANGNNYVFADSTNILDGIAYVFARAAEAKQACVVNLSASDSLGAHDGTALGEQFLDNLLLEPNRVITLSAGNDNISGAHTSGHVTAGGTTNVVLAYYAYQWDDAIQIWYDGHDRFAVELTVPTTPPTVIGPVAAGGPPVSVAVGGLTITVESSLKQAVNDDNLIEIRLWGGGAVPNGNWNVALHGTVVINGAFDAWVDTSYPPPGSAASHTWQAAVAGSGTMGVPSTARRAIAVGAHDGAANPGILPFSGCGPTRDGRIKPDITAPGFDILGAMLRDMNLGGGLLETPFPISGTSFAAPIVAGAAALVFECRGLGLTSGDIKQLFSALAGLPPIGSPSNTFGFGFLQMSTACSSVLPLTDVWMRDHPTDTGVEPYAGNVTWQSPDIEVYDALGNPVDNPLHDSSNLWNNLVDVTVRNRGTQAATNIDVYLYWADPATNIPFPDEWKSSGIYTGQPDFLQQGNRIVVPLLPALASATVRFAWAPPAPGSNIEGDDHFCLIARVEQEADPSNLGGGGWPVIRGSNNIALRNVHVHATGSEVSSGFAVVGSDEWDALELTCHRLTGRVDVVMPTRGLPWRERVVLDTSREPRPPYGCRCGADPAEDIRRVLNDREAKRILAATGAGEAHVDGGATRLVLRAGEQRLQLSQVRVQHGARMPVRVNVRQPQVTDGVGWIHVAQRSCGKIVGGVSLELRERLHAIVRYDVVRRGDRVEVRPRRERKA
jgi:hypothetical protein